MGDLDPNPVDVASPGVPKLTGGIGPLAVRYLSYLMLLQQEEGSARELQLPQTAPPKEQWPILQHTIECRSLLFALPHLINLEEGNSVITNTSYFLLPTSSQSFSYEIDQFHTLRRPSCQSIPNNSLSLYSNHILSKLFQLPQRTTSSIPSLNPHRYVSLIHT